MSDKDTKKPNDTHTHLAPNNTNLTKNPLGTIIIAVISVAISVTAGILSWKCNVRQNLFVRVLLFGVAFSFSEIYLTYYLIYRVIMGNQCPA